ncbi:MAG: tetratricopeptide repeat protein [Thiohalomonadales bacterium]
MLVRFFVFFILLLAAIPITPDNLISQKLFEYHSALASNGDAESMYIVGNMYENGKGVDVDFAEAIKWYKSSAKKGNSRAKKRVRQVNRKMRLQFD